MYLILSECPKTLVGIFLEKDAKFALILESDLKIKRDSGDVNSCNQEY